LNQKLIVFLLLAGMASFLATTCSVDSVKSEVQDEMVPFDHEYASRHGESTFVTNPDSNNCLSCHSGIEPIRSHSSGMMQEIFAVASESGFKNNECIVCHGGNPTAKNEGEAHMGTVESLSDLGGPLAFYPDPASVWINDRTCGMCHQEQVSTQFTSLMFTEAGKIQGTTWGFGGIQGYEHNVANVAVEELEVHKRLGSDIHRKYMEELKEAEPQVFPGNMSALPEAPTQAELKADPSTSVYTYLRTECQRCHTGVKGHNADGDYRGTGCGSCHIPYSGKGLYEGDDESIDKREQGHLLVHSIQSSRDANVKVHDKHYSGIPTKTCTSCHNRGRRIGVSYEGLMESSYQSPFMGDASDQKKIHKKNYIHLESDIHLKKGMVCQDCHTSGDMHSLGDLSGAIQGAVEIECQDCHGTPDQFPWELPIGYGDEIAGDSPKTGAPRGVSDTVESYLKMGWVAPRKEGYLISARGNPMPHLVKTGDEVILHSSSGKDIQFSPLKKLAQDDKLSLEARIAMDQIHSHIDKLECYACHATWAPQCYGCHINIDYSDPSLKLDWVKVASNPDENGQTADVLSEEEVEQIEAYLVSGKVKEQRSYLRWEDPPLVVNGESRVSPAIPGCQTTVTVKDSTGQVTLLNHIFKIKHVEGAGEEGQNAIDMSPLHPHTVQLKARSCESCHADPKAMGYGINAGEFYSDPSQNIVMDLVDSSGQPLAMQIDTQFNAIENLNHDWSTIIDSSGKQVQTVGHHFSGSRPFNAEELAKIDRRGVCASCHQTIPDQDIAIDLLSHVAKYSDGAIDSDDHSQILNKSIRVSAWVQVILVILAIIGAVMSLKFVINRKRS